jgi:hypothetical protein
VRGDRVWRLGAAVGLPLPRALRLRLLLQQLLPLRLRRVRRRAQKHARLLRARLHAHLGHLRARLPRELALHARLRHLPPCRRVGRCQQLLDAAWRALHHHGEPRLRLAQLAQQQAPLLLGCLVPLHQRRVLLGEACVQLVQAVCL